MLSSITIKLIIWILFPSKIVLRARLNVMFESYMYSVHNNPQGCINNLSNLGIWTGIFCNLYWHSKVFPEVLQMFLIKSHITWDHFNIDWRRNRSIIIRCYTGVPSSVGNLCRGKHQIVSYNYRIRGNYKMSIVWPRVCWHRIPNSITWHGVFLVFIQCHIAWLTFPARCTF